MKKNFIIQCCICFRIKEGKKWVNKGLKKLIEASHWHCPKCKEERDKSWGIK